MARAHRKALRKIQATGRLGGARKTPLHGTRERVHLAGNMARAHRKALLKIKAAGRLEGARKTPLHGTRKRVHLAGNMARAHRKALLKIKAAGRLEGARKGLKGREAATREARGGTPGKPGFLRRSRKKCAQILLLLPVHLRQSLSVWSVVPLPPHGGL
jgi:hypothetical protein